MSNDKTEATRLADHIRIDQDWCEEAAALLRRWPDGEPVDSWLKPWETARFGVFLPDGTFEELPASDPVGEKHPHGHTARWVGGSSDVQLLRAALRTAPPDQSERIAALEQALEQARVALRDARASLDGRGHNAGLIAHVDAALRKIEEVRRG